MFGRGNDIVSQKGMKIKACLVLSSGGEDRELFLNLITQ